MVSIIYKDAKEVCRVSYTGKTIVSIQGSESEKIEGILRQFLADKYIWEILADEIMEMGYIIRTRHE